MSGCAELVRSVLGRQNGSWTDHETYEDRFIDFESSLPSETDRMLYDTVEQIMLKGDEVLFGLVSYGEGPAEAARKAVSECVEGDEKVAVAARMEPFIERIRASHVVAKNIQQVLPKLLWELCSGPLSPAEQLETRQALVRQFASIIVYCLRFDEAKMRTPAILNHFSIYRRLVSTIEPLASHQDVQADNDTAWFIAMLNPMTDLLCKSVESFVEETAKLPRENTIDTLYTIIRVCSAMLSPPPPSSSPSPPPLSSTSRIFVQRALVGCILIFDTVHPQGSFHRDSPIDMKAVVSVLTTEEHNKAILLQPLLEQLNHTKKIPVNQKIRSLLEA